MATSDLRTECGFTNKADLTKAIDELQRKMKVVPQQVLYIPKFTYIWTLAEARFPDEMKTKMSREDAVPRTRSLLSFDVWDDVARRHVAEVRLLSVGVRPSQPSARR